MMTNQEFHYELRNDPEILLALALLGIDISAYTNSDKDQVETHDD